MLVTHFWPLTEGISATEVNFNVAFILQVVWLEKTYCILFSLKCGISVRLAPAEIWLEPPIDHY